LPISHHEASLIRIDVLSRALTIPVEAKWIIVATVLVVLAQSFVVDIMQKKKPDGAALVDAYLIAAPYIVRTAQPLNPILYLRDEPFT
jgi:hypothetical protein